MSESIKHGSLAAALAAFQAELPTVGKDNTAKVKSERTGAEFTYKYADLGDISPVVLGLLGKHGLAWTTRPTMTVKSGFVLKFKLMHESGEAEKGTYPLPAPNTPPQQLGSAISYARRYALLAVTGVAPGGDDDDAASAPAGPKRGRNGRPHDVQLASRDWIAEAREAKSIEALRSVYNEAEMAGELGARLHADDQETIAETLWKMRGQKVPAAPAKKVQRKPLDPTRGEAPALPDDALDPAVQDDPAAPVEAGDPDPSLAAKSDVAEAEAEAARLEEQRRLAAEAFMNAPELEEPPVDWAPPAGES